MTGSISQLPRRSRARNPWAVLAIVISGAFMLLVDVSIVNVAIPRIQDELNASSGQIELIAAAYQLAFACVLITAGRLGDIHGRRRMFLIGMAGFTLTSAVAGAAPTAGTLVVARVLQGFLGGIMFPQVLSVIQVTFPPERRGRAFGVFGAVIGVATALGPLLGGLLIYADVLGLGWRTIFYVNIPIGATALLAAWWWLPESQAPGAPRMDVSGVVLVTAGLFMLIYPITEGRAQGWPAYMQALLGTSVVVLAAFLAFEHRKTRQDSSPLVPTTLFRDPAFRVGLALVFVFLLGLPAFFFTFTLFLQNGFGYTPLEAGLVQFAFAVGSGTASFHSDRLTRRIGWRVLSVGSSTVACGMAGLLLAIRAMGTELDPLILAPLLLLGGAGLGTFIAPVINIVLSNVRSAIAGSASGVLTTVQRVGGAVGVAMAGALFFGLLSVHAGQAARTVEPGLTHRLQAAGVSPAATERVVAGFRNCFVERVNSGSPRDATSACAEPAAGASRLSPDSADAVERAIRGYAAPEALRTLFSYAFQRALMYEIGIFVLAFFLVFLLPRARGGGTSRAGPESLA